MTREGLIDATIACISNDGLEGATLRGVADLAHCSTAVVFQNFSGKSDLLSVAIRAALEEDRCFHDNFRQNISGLDLSAANFADLISSYLELRTRTRIAAVWSEVLFKSTEVEGAMDCLSQWVAMRRDFWTELSVDAGGGEDFGVFLATYLTMEEVYALVLHRDIQYGMLVRETIRSLVRGYLGDRTAEVGSAASSFAKARSDGFGELFGYDESDLKGRLLELASQEIIAHGIQSIDFRNLTRRAGGSLSMISYHFGGTAEFVNQAIWRALIKEIPREVNPYRQGGERLGAIELWAELIAGLINPDAQGAKAGFYIGVSRLIGQASLLARRQADLVPIILHLRKIEGAGTHRASQTIWPEDKSIDPSSAAVFGIWVKGQAMMNLGVARERRADGAAILAAALPLLS